MFNLYFSMIVCKVSDVFSYTGMYYERNMKLNASYVILYLVSRICIDNVTIVELFRFFLWNHNDIVCCYCHAL